MVRGVAAYESGLVRTAGRRSLLLAVPDRATARADAVLRVIGGCLRHRPHAGGARGAARQSRREVERLLIAALSVVAFLALAERLASARTALQLTIIYAFGSETWTISSQALWQHGASELLITLALLCLLWAAAEPER